MVYISGGDRSPPRGRGQCPRFSSATDLTRPHTMTGFATTPPLWGEAPVCRVLVFRGLLKISLRGYLLHFCLTYEWKLMLPAIGVIICDKLSKMVINLGFCASMQHVRAPISFL